jgi:hypothetical protein
MCIRERLGSSTWGVKRWTYHRIESSHLSEHKRYAGKDRPTACTPLKAIAWQIQAQVRADDETMAYQKQVKASLENILLWNWLQAIKRSMTADTGSNLSCRPLWRTVQTEASGCQRPSKQGRRVPVCTHGHGGCDDSSGDTRLGRGLPFGRMPCVLPRIRCLRDS